MGLSHKPNLGFFWYGNRQTDTGNQYVNLLSFFFFNALCWQLFFLGNGDGSILSEHVNRTEILSDCTLRKVCKLRNPSTFSFMTQIYTSPPAHNVFSLTGFLFLFLSFRYLPFLKASIFYVKSLDASWLSLVSVILYLLFWQENIQK